MSLAGLVVAIGLWIVAGLLVYGAVSYLLLFYLPSADRLPWGAVADVCFAFTLPLVLAATWLATLRNRG